MQLNTKKLSEDLYLFLKKTPLREASKKTGISIATLSRIQNEHLPSVENYATICKFMGVSLDTYFKPFKKK